VPHGFPRRPSPVRNEIDMFCEVQSSILVETGEKEHARELLEGSSWPDLKRGKTDWEVRKRHSDDQVRLQYSKISVS
jgi:hypothetical protein